MCETLKIPTREDLARPPGGGSVAVLFPQGLHTLSPNISFVFPLLAREPNSRQRALSFVLLHLHGHTQARGAVTPLELARSCTLVAHRYLVPRSAEGLETTKDCIPSRSRRIGVNKSISPERDETVSFTPTRIPSSLAEESGEIPLGCLWSI